MSELGKYYELKQNSKELKLLELLLFKTIGIIV